MRLRVRNLIDLFSTHRMNLELAASGSKAHITGLDS